MSGKVKRKVTVENNKDNADPPRRPSVFERLGPGAVNISSLSQDRHSRGGEQEKCRNWLRTGICSFGSSCRYQHDPYPNTGRRGKGDKEIDEKDLRHKVRIKREESKEPRTGSVSPKRKSRKRSGSRSRKGDHESKIKSTVVVTRPRSPASDNEDHEKKNKDGSWEEDSDDWPMDATQLDYKEELTLERKRQQLQRELELELQKEQMMNESVTITKTVSFSESSSSSSSSDSGSISSSSDSSSSSSDDDSDDDSSSSSSSSSSSGSQQTVVKTKKKPPPPPPPPPPPQQPQQHIKELSDKGHEHISHSKSRDTDHIKLKNSRSKGSAMSRPSPSPSPEPKSGRRHRDKRDGSSLSPKRRTGHEDSSHSGKGSSTTRGRGPRTPSPPAVRKQRQWEQSSSADSKEGRRGKSKRHKRRRDQISRNENYRPHVPTPPLLSSPNRTALSPMVQLPRKHRQRGSNLEDLQFKVRQRGQDVSPLLPLLPRSPQSSASPRSQEAGNRRRFLSPDRDKSTEKKRGGSPERGRSSSKKPLLSHDNYLKGVSGRDSRASKKPKTSPRHESSGHKDLPSPYRERGGETNLNRRRASPSSFRSERIEESSERRKYSLSPPRVRDVKDKRRGSEEAHKKRDRGDGSPHVRDDKDRHSDRRSNRRDEDARIKRGSSPGSKKGREDRSRDHCPKSRNVESDSVWNEENRKTLITGNRAADSHIRQDSHNSQTSVQKSDRGRDRDRERKKGKERDRPGRGRDDDRQITLSPSRSPSRTIRSIREVEPLLPRTQVYDSEVPANDREYGYSYDAHKEQLYLGERHLLPDYGPDLRRGPPPLPPPSLPLCTPDIYSDRCRRDVPTMKEPVQHRFGFSGRDIPPREILPGRDLLGVPPGRGDDYLPEMTVDERHLYDEPRWNRNRPPPPLPPLHDEWDGYSGLPAGPLPLTAPLPPVLDEDRYGMPRRRRPGSPDWPMARQDKRNLPPSPVSHRGQPREQKISRSPQTKRSSDVSPANRGNWERPTRRNNRVDNRRENQPKDERKKVNRRDRRDREHRRETQTTDNKSVQSGKRQPSRSPAGEKDGKKRKTEEETSSSNTLTTASTVEVKSVSPSLVAANSGPQSPAPPPLPPPPPPAPPPAPVPEKRPETGTTSPTPTAKVKTEEKKPPEEEEEEEGEKADSEKATAVDNFSDWSDDDDDLLTRDDFPEEEEIKLTEKKETEVTLDEKGDKNDKLLPTPVEERGRKATKDAVDHSVEKVKQSHSRTGSRERGERTNGDSVKVEQNQEVRETETATTVKEESYVEDIIPADDYESISDDELEEVVLDDADDPDGKVTEGEKTGLADSLDVDWSGLLTESRTKPEFIPGYARKRFTTAHVLARIGFSQSLAGPELTNKILTFCQDQLNKESTRIEDSEGNKPPSVDQSASQEEFKMEHPIAAFHVALRKNKKERASVMHNFGPYRRALCARQDLLIRRQLCKPANKLSDPVPSSYSNQHTVDKDLYKLSLELLKQKSTLHLPQTVHVSC